MTFERQRSVELQVKLSVEFFFLYFSFSFRLHRTWGKNDVFFLSFFFHRNFSDNFVSKVRQKCRLVGVRRFVIWNARRTTALRWRRWRRIVHGDHWSSRILSKIDVIRSNFDLQRRKFRNFISRLCKGEKAAPRLLVAPGSIVLTSKTISQKLC